MILREICSDGMREYAVFASHPERKARLTKEMRVGRQIASTGWRVDGIRILRTNRSRSRIHTHMLLLEN